jgi:hypothetical protein
MIAKAQPAEATDFYHTYFKQIPEGADVGKILQDRLTEAADLWRNIPAEKHDFAYAPGKWTVKQVLGHIIDTERIMTFRALAFARHEKQPLPGFDENDYVANADFPYRTLPDLITEFEILRQSTLLFFKNSDEKTLDNQGIASGKTITVRALANIIAGHEMHHSHILQERYL